MNKLHFFKKILKNGGLFFLVFVITFFIIFKDKNFFQIIKAASNVNLEYIFIAIGCMSLFILFEAINIGRTLKIYNYNTKFLKCIKYAFVGFFFSSVTPMATGGQPMQLYYMHKDNIEISHSALSLMMELASYQIVTVSMAIMAYIYKYKFFNSIGYELKYILLAGVVINTIILVFILMAFFSRRTIEKILFAIIKFLNFIKVKNVNQVRAKALDQLEMYHKGALAFKENKLVIIKILLTTILQITAYHSIPFWIYRAFGYDEYGFITVLAIQAVLYITVSAIPLPGSVGVSESGFVLIYRALFPTHVISSAMLLSRGISFYLFLIISGIFITFVYMKNNNFKIGYHLNYR